MYHSSVGRYVNYHVRWKVCDPKEDIWKPLAWISDHFIIHNYARTSKVNIEVRKENWIMPGIHSRTAKIDGYHVQKGKLIHSTFKTTKSVGQEQTVHLFKPKQVPSINYNYFR